MDSPSAESRKFGFMAHLRGTAGACLILIFDCWASYECMVAGREWWLSLCGSSFEFSLTYSSFAAILDFWGRLQSSLYFFNVFQMQILNVSELQTWCPFVLVLELSVHDVISDVITPDYWSQYDHFALMIIAKTLWGTVLKIISWKEGK